MRRILALLCVWSMGCGSQAEPAPPRAAAANTTAAKSEAAPVRRMVIRQASLQLRSDQPQRIAEQAGRVAAAAGGFVLNSEARSVDGRLREAEVQLRVPEPAFESTLRQLRGLGTLLQENVTGEDVSEEFVDVSARLRARRTLEARLLALVEKSNVLKDVLLVEQELNRVRSEIEQDEGRGRYLEERTSMAAIVLVAQLPPEPFANLTRDAATRLTEAAALAGELTLSVSEFTIAAAGFVLPLSPLLLAVWIVSRRRRIARAASAV